jgi:hypothetical protein
VVVAGCPRLFYICMTRVLAVEPVQELLTSNPPKSRAPVAPALVEQISRPLVDDRTLRGSYFSSPGLGPREGHAYLVRVRAIKCQRTWPRSCVAGAPFQATQPHAQWATWAGGRDGPPRLFGCRAVMMARVHATGRFGRGGVHSSVTSVAICRNARSARGSGSVAPMDL